MASKLMVKRGTTASWAKSNTAQDTTLSPGQLGIEYRSEDGVSRVKVGPDKDAHTPTEWDDIPRYLAPDPSVYLDEEIKFTGSAGSGTTTLSTGFHETVQSPSSGVATKKFVISTMAMPASSNSVRYTQSLVLEPGVEGNAGSYGVYADNPYGSKSLGLSNKHWDYGYINYLYGESIGSAASPFLTGYFTTNYSTTVRPPVESSGYVGTSSYPFSYGYINTMYISSSYTDTIYPRTSGTSLIGTSSSIFASAYVNKVYTSGNIDEATSNIDRPMALSFTRKENISCNTVTTPGLYMMRLGITDGPIHSGSSAVSYMSMLCMASDASASYRQYIAIKEGTTDLYVRASNTGAWKRITVASGTAAPSGTANVGDVYIQYI